jgi:hypothetical protein
MKLNRRILRTALVWVFLVVFMMVTTPDRLPVVLLIVPFVLFFAACYESWELLQQIRTDYFGHDRLPKRLGAVVCICAALLLVLQSLGQLTLRDVITLASIVFLGYLYAGRVNLSLPRHPS